jgi:glycosyltransferase involved in cell wall biosynthesis
MQETRLSVALVTRNRPVSLKRTLDSLHQQSVQPWEVIISDDSDDDQTGAVADIAAAYGHGYVRGPRRGLYANRNQVAIACQGSHVRTMDDDHEFPPGHFEECLKAIAADRNAIWIIGEYLAEQTNRTIPPECPGQLHPRGFSTAPPNPDDCWALADGASIYPRAVFEAGHRFSEAFPFGATYLEFGSRLHWLGYRMRQLATTYVIHHYEASNRSFADPQSEMAAEFFAMFCHSFLHQPSLRNKLLTVSQVIWQRLRRGPAATRSLQFALEQYRAQARTYARRATNRPPPRCK